VHFKDKLPSFSALFKCGGLGVYMFFVISGFVIPFAMREMRYELPRTTGAFLARRLIRLEPTYFVATLIALTLSYLAASTPGYAGAPPSFDVISLVAQFGYLADWLDKPWINASVDTSD
jgi:peptidoglycan/LPS O-acetylase OafA/YrhL